MASRIAIARGAVRQRPDGTAVLDGWCGQRAPRQPPPPVARPTSSSRFVSSMASGAAGLGQHKTSLGTATPRRPQPRGDRRFPKFLVDSPNATLALRLKSRTEPLTFAAWQRFDAVARSHSLRLPVVALQMMIRQDEARAPTSLSQSLCSEAEWRARLHSLAYKGISEADIRHWLWILAARDPDERIARFAAGGGDIDSNSNSNSSMDRPKPLFLLFQLLRRDETFRKGSSLALLYRYVARHHVQTRGGGGHTDHPAPSDSAARPFGAVRRTLDPGLNMTPQTFATTLRLLVHHYRRLWPSALPAVARLTCAYVETLQRTTRNPQQAYADACKLFNLALTLFQGKSPVSPVSSMRHNWRAQKVLLAMSTTTTATTTTTDTAAVAPRPLLISRDGFRAIRRVMLAQGKSPDERRVALRMARTWPPYRRVWDGLDEQRQPADDLSRSVRAGVLMCEAGYAETEHDRALSVLGGVQAPGETPTVQTRSLSPRTWTGRQASLNVFSTWAARVKATRDVNEAWHEFQEAPAVAAGGGSTTTTTVATIPLRPNVQVYAELFKKLLAAPINALHVHNSSGTQASPSSGALLPGDAREVFPVNDATLTAFEKQRLRPPSVATLYAQMLREGCRPVGDCLAVLVQNAPSLEAGLQYLRDSPIDSRAVAALRLPRLSARDLTSDASSPPPSLDLLRGIPLPVLNAYVHLLCRFQPRSTAEPARLGKLQRTALVHHAIRLCAVRLPAARHAGRTYKAPWHTILRTLAQPRLLVSVRHTEGSGGLGAGADAGADARQQYHDTEALALALRVFGRVQQVAGIDVVLFDSLNKATLKALQWVDPTVLAVAKEDGAEDETATSAEGVTATVAVLRQAHASLAAAFQELTNQNDTCVAPDHPSTPHNVTAGCLEAYLPTLGYLGDRAGLVAALRWVLGVWDDDAVLEDAKDPEHRQHAAMGRVFALFRAFTEDRDGPEGPEDAAADADILDLQRQLAWLQQHRGCTWRWATREDADEYVRWHRQAHNATFWDQVRPGVW